ncbi:MAG: hypothetical protein V1821_03060 [bacterium]
MTSRTKKAAIIILILFIIGLVVLWLFWRQTPQVAEEPEVTAPVETLAEEVIETSTAPVTPLAPVDALSRNLIRFSMQFAERYGSFSSESNFQNLRDLEPVMTPGLNSYVESYIATAEAPAEFYGVTTRAATSEIITQTDTAAYLEVLTQRTETKGTAAARTYNQTLQIWVVKQGENWKADKAEWVVVK